MLVLATMFISVSSSLPTTAYIKMIDVWLIFNLLVPFLLVLVHTYMDILRTDAQDEEEGRSINHHGKTVIVGLAESGLKEAEAAVDAPKGLTQSLKLEVID